MGVLDGKVAIITGAGGGIGREHALLFAREGARIVVNDLGGTRDGSGKGESMADAVVAEIRAAGGEAVASYDDVSTREGADNMAWTGINTFGRLDILVNNAGILRDRTMLKMSEAQWDAVMAVHLRGTFLCTQTVGRILKAQGDGGSIVNTSSVSGLTGNFGQANYAAAKMGIAGFTFTCSKELAKARVNVNAIAPVAITRMTEDLPLAQGVSMDELGPQFISPVALFLASPMGQEITGKCDSSSSQK